MLVGSPVAEIPFRDTLPLQMLTQRILNSNVAYGSFIVKYRRSHIFPHRNIGTGCLHRSRSLFRGRSFAPLRMIPKNRQASPAGKAARAGFPIPKCSASRRVSNAWKTVQWTVFSEKRAAAQDGESRAEDRNTGYRAATCTHKEFLPKQIQP